MCLNRFSKKKIKAQFLISPQYHRGIVLIQKRGTYWRVNILVLAVNHIENKNPENHNVIVILKGFIFLKVPGADQESFCGLGKL